MAHDLFICYSPPHKSVADAVCAALEARGVRCWVSPRDLPRGLSSAEGQAEALNASRLLVMVMASSRGSPPRVPEIERAVNNGIPVLPFRLDDAPLGGLLKVLPADTHWLDLMTPALSGHLARFAEIALLLLARPLQPPAGVAEVGPSGENGHASVLPGSRRPPASPLDFTLQPSPLGNLSAAEGYACTINSASPALLVLLLELSHSMTDMFAGSRRSKREALAIAVNRFLGELLCVCEGGEKTPRSYFEIAVAGYTTAPSGRPVVEPALGGALACRDIVTTSDLYDNPLDVETRLKDDGVGGLVEIKSPIWFCAPAPGKEAGAPMCAALAHCGHLAGEWCALHPHCFPPVVLHVSDGISTDGDPEPVADALRGLGTEDGRVLLFNCYLSSAAAVPVLFPAREEALPDEYARLLFRMSSLLPERLRGLLAARDMPAPEGARGMMCNENWTRLLSLFSVGTTLSPRAIRSESEAVRDGGQLR